MSQTTVEGNDAPSITERDARRALEQQRVFDETLVRGLLADIDRLREALRKERRQ